MNRKEKLLKFLDKTGLGIEIGPSHSPIASKKEGYNVHVIDCANREGLIRKFKNHDVNLNNIEEVDYVWNGENYSDLTGKSKHYDWIIASHVIEHTPDLIGFLNNCDEVLKEDGVISLAVPDKRYCFDHYRPITGISKIIDNHFQNNKIHTPGTVAEYFLNIVSKDKQIAWSSTSTGEYRLFHTLENAQQGMNAAQNDKTYLDVHAWCFVPYSFRLIIHDLFSLGLIPFREVGFFPTEGCEFFVTLGRNGTGVNQTRLEMLELIEFELKEVEHLPKNISVEHSYTPKPRAGSFIKRIAKRFI